MRSASHLALMLTRRCNMQCGHCSVESHPRISAQPSVEELLGRVDSAASAGVRSLLLTGGEPMIRLDVVLQVLKRAVDRGMRCSMTSNGFWGKSPEKARETLQALLAAGLTSLNLSYDQYHADFQSSQPTIHIAQAAEELKFPVAIVVTRTRDDAALSEFMASFANLKEVTFRVYDVQAVGAARGLDVAAMRGEVEGICNACSSPALTDDGRLTACNGPAYFSPSDSPLVMGALADKSMAQLLRQHAEDPVLDAIRTRGVSYLRTELSSAGFEFRPQYSGMCELCHHICHDPEAVKLLRERLAAPALTAERAARERVIRGARSSGTLNRRWVNTAGVGRALIFQDSGFEQVLGRADVDWERWARTLIECGVAGPVANRLPLFKRWAPTFFQERITQAATRAALRKSVQREVLRVVAAECARMGVTPVLLKGGALLASDPDARATGDLDIWLPAAEGTALHASLLGQGWQGAADPGGTMTHHLSPIAFRGIPVEIHTSLMPAFWGLPEKEMLVTVCVLPRWNVGVLSPEAFLLHTLVHSTKHVFSHGLKTAYDLTWAVRQPEFSWSRFTALLSRTSTPRAALVPLQVLAGDLQIDLPDELLRMVPQDWRQRYLLEGARRALYHRQEHSRKVNPFLRLGCYSLLQDSWRGLLDVLLRSVGGDAAENVQATRRRWSLHTVGELRQHWMEAWRAGLSLRG